MVPALAAIALLSPVAVQASFVHDPERGAEVIAYDGANRIDWSAPGTALTNAATCNQANVSAADKIVRGYDDRDRLTAINYPDTTLDEARTYFEDGALQSITRGSGAEEVTWSYTYNKRRLLTREQLKIDTALPQNTYTEWSYNPLGHVERLKYIDGYTIEYQPNALGQPTVVRTSDLSQTYAHSISYWPNGALQQFSYGNGVVHTLTQNTRQLPLRSLDQSGATKIIDYTFGYDRNANPTAITDGVSGAIDSKTMTYDDLDRLETVTAAGTFGTASMQFDALDNLTKYQVGSRDHRHVTDPATQRLTRINNAVGTQLFGFVHNPRGDIVQKNQTGNNLAFTFDRAHRLTEVKRNSVLESTYRYDGHGRRIKTIKPGGDFRYQIYSQSGQYLWDANFDKNEPAQTLTTTAYDYIHLQGSLIAKRESISTASFAVPLFADSFETQTRAPDAPQSPDTPQSPDFVTTDPFAPNATAALTFRYVHTDALGSPVVETNASGAEIPGSRTRYEPYGLPLTTPPEGTPSYTGHQYDTSTGLIYAQQRYLDPLGFFVSTDEIAVNPTSAGNWNRYAYGGLSPYRFTDPDGREVDCVTCDAQWGDPNHIDSAQLGPGAMALGMTIIAFTPLLGDAVAIGEAVAAPTAANIIGAGVGLVPGAGDIAGKIIKNADTARDASVIYRRGDSAETATRPERKASEAEASNIGIHGVSGSTTKPSGPCSSATCGALESAGFNVHPTPTRADPNHVTIELPKPVTKPVAEKFNEVLGRDK
ncbi:MAG: hypothetical protein IPG63_18460 [Xanthomonadales bacterium]|nr:hypothetical protein [Xanthomonadales bacterium]